MEIFEIGIDQLIPSPRVLRKNDCAVHRMMAVIKEYGIPIPILGRHRGETIEIVDGHLRVKASRKMDLPTIPVVFCDEWTEAQVKGFRLLVNRSATWATWADELVALELADLDALDFDLSLTGFDPFEIDEFLFPDDIEPSAEKVPDMPKSAVTRLGDLWLCDSHRILAGDATSPEAVGAVNGKELPKMFLSDPPYGVGYDPNWRERAGLRRAQQTGLVKNDDRVDWTEAYKLFLGDVRSASRWILRDYRTRQPWDHPVGSCAPFVLHLRTERKHRVKTGVFSIGIHHMNTSGGRPRN